METVTKYYMSDDRTVGNDIYLSDRLVPAGLAVGTDNAWTGVFPIPTLGHGHYYLVACADNGNAVPEINEGNKCRFSSTMIRVGMPELWVSSLSNPPDHARRGDKFQVTDTTVNRGAAPTAFQANTMYYLSLDMVKDASDVVLGGRLVGMLAGGAASNGDGGGNRTDNGFPQHILDAGLRGRRGQSTRNERGEQLQGVGDAGHGEVRSRRSRKMESCVV